MAVAPRIETERLVLRARTLEDLPDFAAMWKDERVYAPLTGQPLPPEEAWARFARMCGSWELCGYGAWIVEEKASGRLVGEAGAAFFSRDIEPPLEGPEFGWVFCGDAHGKGYATEAVKAGLAWTDEAFPDARACCLISPSNAPSLRVAAKCGFVEKRRATYKNHEAIILERARP